MGFVLEIVLGAIDWAIYSVITSQIYQTLTGQTWIDQRPSDTHDGQPLCKYYLGNETSATLTLPGGRKLGYAQYGAPNGRAILYMHGLPGARTEAVAWHEIAMKLNARIIAVDRPGYGWSSPCVSRTISDHAKDVDLLTSHLALEEYCVMGISGGGPYALACAHSLPANKLKGVAVICGLGPPDMGTAGMRWLNWLGFNVAWRYFPRGTKWWFKLDAATYFHLSDEERFRLFKKQFLDSNPPAKDLAALTDDEGRLFVNTVKQTFRQGFDGMTQDGKLLASDFDFRIEDIRRDVPIDVWHGKLDVYVPLSHAEQTVERLGDQAKLHAKDETHLTIYTNWREDIMQTLVDKFNPA